MRKITMLLLALSLGALAGCETVKGAGQDISNAGRALDRTF